LFLPLATATRYHEIITPFYIFITALDVKNRWRCLRDKFVREKKRLVLDGEAAYRCRDPWPLLDDMSFLWEFINHRKYVKAHLNSTYKAVSFMKSSHVFTTNYCNYVNCSTRVICGRPPRLKLIFLSSGLLRSVRWFKTDVSGLHIGTKTSGLNHLTPRNNPEDGRIHAVQHFRCCSLRGSVH
jgi:hypothetical protein